jgi:hypothetical protein
MGLQAAIRGTRAWKGQPRVVLRPMGFGRGHEAQCRKPARLEGTTNSEELLGALDVGFMVLGFVLCYVIWTRPKNTPWIDFGYPTDNPWVDGNTVIRARMTSGRFRSDPWVKTCI